MESKSISTENHELTFEADTLTIKKYGKPPLISTPKEINTNKKRKKAFGSVFQAYYFLIFIFWCLKYFQPTLLPNFLQESPFIFDLFIWIPFLLGFLISKYFLQRAIIKSIKYTEINYIIHKKSFWGTHTATIYFNNTLKQGKIKVVFIQTSIHASTDWNQFKNQITKRKLLLNKF